LWPTTLALRWEKMIVGFIACINQDHNCKEPPFALYQKRHKLLEIDFLESVDQLATPRRNGLLDAGNKGWRFGHGTSLNCFAIDRVKAFSHMPKRGAHQLLDKKASTP
jgi:hypothetical protein